MITVFFILYSLLCYLSYLLYEVGFIELGLLWSSLGFYLTLEIPARCSVLDVDCTLSYTTISCMERATCSSIETNIKLYTQR